MKGRCVMMGYLKNEKATTESIDPQGYFHSGDLGRLDEEGFVYITGRIKELIITAAGENIAPTNIEDNFKLECPISSNIIVVGENRKFLSALITLKVNPDPATGAPTQILTTEVQDFLKNQLKIESKTSDEVIQNEALMKYIKSCMEKVNEKCVSRAAQVKKWQLLPVDFSMNGDELTPTLKLRRKFTEKKYKDIIDKFYEGDAKL